MGFFDLPDRTKVGRVVPKNAFDEYTNTKQKKLFTDCIQRITWTHKLSADTVNLEAKDILEIQVFKVELKQKSDILKILEIINKSISYHIVFWVEFDQEAYISTASKHPHPTNENIAVIDWTFTSNWFNKRDFQYSFKLKNSLDEVFKHLCLHTIGKPEFGKVSLNSIVLYLHDLERIKKEISRIKQSIKREEQFNKKVNLNIQLKDLEMKLNSLKLN